MKGHEAFALGQEQLKEASLAVPVGKAFKPRRIETPIDRLMRNNAGKRSYTKTSRKRGRYVQSRPANGRVTDLALDATIRQAAPHQLKRQNAGNRFAVQHEDMCEKVRVRRASNTILFVVDASWSMAAAERMQATKGAILSLLKDAYQRRDRVGLVVFQKEEARLALPLTNSVELAQRELGHIPVGGKTPLPAALMMGHQVLSREMRRNREAMPLMILLTDGAGNVSLTDRPAQDEALEIARHIRRNCIRSVVINMEHEAYDRGLAQNLAEELGAPCYRLKELKAQELYDTVRGELEQAKPTR